MNSYLTVGDLKKQLENVSNDIVIWASDENDDIFPVANYGGIKIIKNEPPKLEELIAFFDDGR